MKTIRLLCCIGLMFTVQATIASPPPPAHQAEYQGGSPPEKKAVIAPTSTTPAMMYVVTGAVPMDQYGYVSPAQRVSPRLEPTATAVKLVYHAVALQDDHPAYGSRLNGLPNTKNESAQFVLPKRERIRFDPGVAPGRQPG